MYFGNYCKCLNSFKTCFKILWWLICWSFILSVFAEGTSPQKVSTQVQGSTPRTAEEVQFQLPVEIAVRIQKMLDAHCLLHCNVEYAVWREWEASCRVEILGMVLSYAQRVGESVACGLFRKSAFCDLHIRSAICRSIENVTEEISCKWQEGCHLQCDWLFCCDVTQVVALFTKKDLCKLSPSNYLQMCDDNIL